MCLAQGANAVTPERLEPATPYLETSILPLSHCAPSFFANSDDPDEMPQNVAFHQFLHRLLLKDKIHSQRKKYYFFF